MVSTRLQPEKKLDIIDDVSKEDGKFTDRLIGLQIRIYFMRIRILQDNLDSDSQLNPESEPGSSE
jgi:hypothetical protein